MTRPASFLLIHSPLVGPTTWIPVAEALRARGSHVVTPSLLPASEGPGPWWEALARAASSEGQRGQWLVAHSGAGPLLPAVAQHHPGPSGFVLVDAGLPHPGKSRLERLPDALAVRLEAMADRDGLLPPWPEWFGADAVRPLLPEPFYDRFVGECPRLPIDMFREPAPPGELPDLSGSYLRLSAAYQTEAERARARGWPVVTIEGHHLFMLDQPEETVAALLEAVEVAVDSPHGSPG